MRAAFPDRAFTHFGVTLGYAREVDDRSDPARHLFDGIRDSVRIVDELLATDRDDPACRRRVGSEKDSLSASWTSALRAASECARVEHPSDIVRGDDAHDAATLQDEHLTPRRFG